MISAEQWLAQGKRTGYGEMSLFYRDEGNSSEVVVLLHGFPTASWDWHRLWPRLKNHFRLIAPDFLGFGFSSKPRKHKYSIIEQADIIEALLQKSGVSEVHLLAHDYGDNVAQELLARFEEPLAGTDGIRIRSVCFLNGGLFSEMYHPWFTQCLMLSPLGPILSRFNNRRSFSRSLQKFFGPKSQPAEEVLANYWFLLSYGGGDKLIHRLMHYIPERKILRTRWVRAMRQTRVPLRLIYGKSDPLSGRQMAHRYRELIPDADVVSLNGIGHFPHMEAPEIVAEEYLSFIKI